VTSTPGHPRFRRYVEIQCQSREVDPIWGEFSIIRSLCTNRHDGGPAKEMTFEGMLPIVADYFGVEIVVFDPNQLGDPVFQAALPPAYQRAYKTTGYGHKFVPGSERCQWWLVRSDDFKVWRPVPPQLVPIDEGDRVPDAENNTDLMGPFGRQLLINTLAGGAERFGGLMPWDAPGVLVPPLNLWPTAPGAAAAVGAPFDQPDVVALPDAHWNRVSAMSGCRDIGGLNGHMPRWPDPVTRAGWAVEWNPAMPDPAPLQDVFHVCSGMAQVVGGWSVAQRHSTTVTRYLELKDEITNLDLRTAPYHVGMNAEDQDYLTARL
jgi:hypothetical protein